MHIRENAPVITGAGCEIALRVGATLLDESKGFVRSPVIQTAVARQVFRFIDSDHYFDAEVTGHMLNALHFAPPDLRAAFYDEVRTCRRRRGRESVCRSSHTELDREDCVPCEISISFFFCFCCVCSAC